MGVIQQARGSHVFSQRAQTCVHETRHRPGSPLGTLLGWFKVSLQKESHSVALHWGLSPHYLNLRSIRR